MEDRQSMPFIVRHTGSDGQTATEFPARLPRPVP